MPKAPDAYGRPSPASHHRDTRAPYRNPGRPKPEPGELPEAPDGYSRLILGQHAVREALRAPDHRVAQVLVERDPNPRAAALLRFAEDQKVATLEVTRAQLERMAGPTLHQGVAAFAKPLKLTPFERLLENPELLALALDGVVDPQNFGAAIRSAVGLAGAPIIWPENASAPLTPTTFRASAGAIEHAQLCRVSSLPSALEQAKAQGVQVVGLAPEAEPLLHELDWSGPTILVIGSEEKGMGKAVRKSCTQLARLTQAATVQSLNASVAAGVAVHTVLVQRLIVGKKSQ